jgi:hypothetical protein
LLFEERGKGRILGPILHHPQLLLTKTKHAP